MTHLRKLSLISVTFFITACVVQSARAAEPPDNLCTLLSPAQVSATLGGTYDSPQKSTAPRFSAGTVEGTDCTYQPKEAAGSKVLFRAHVDAKEDETKWLFLRLSKFYKTITPVTGLGDEAYFDDVHGLHVRKGNVRMYITVTPVGEFTPEREKQIKNLGGSVVAQL